VTPPPLLPVTFFADFTCPFSFVTEAALWRLAEGRALELRPRAFQLYPVPEPIPVPAHLPGDLAAAAPLAAEAGVALRPPALRPRTGKAHEAARFAAVHGREEAMRRALYSGYWERGLDIGRIDVLTALAAEVGLDATDLKIALDIDTYRDDVAAHEALAGRLRVARVPTLFIGSGAGTVILEGARELRALDEALGAR
jgi:predicted DsbA family dithiol-disulfide isomerase